MLELDLAKLVKGLLLSAVSHVEGIEEAEGGLGTNLAGEVTIEGRRTNNGSRAASRSKGRGAGNERENEGSLHFVLVLLREFGLSLDERWYVLLVKKNKSQRIGQSKDALRK